MTRLELHTRLPHELTPLEDFQNRLIERARHLTAWYPELTHDSVTELGPDGKVYAGFAKKEAPAGYLSVWI
jgi:hypothetical protein